MITGSKPIAEYRGVSDAVYAEVTADTTEAFTTGQVKNFTWLSEVGKTTDSANEPHYYDNIPAVVVSSTGSDELTLNTSAIPLDVIADITGQFYDETTGMLVEQERTPKYFALGYRTQKTDGTTVYVWRLKGTFSVPDSTHATQNDGTDANGQTLTYTGISTAHKFTATGKSAKAINVDTGINQSITADTFFDTVQTPDTMINQSVAVTGVTVAPKTATVAVNATTTLTATVAPANATNQNVTWTSSDNDKATVSDGIVTGKAAGEVTITATTQDGSFTDTATVTVTAG